MQQELNQTFCDVLKVFCETMKKNPQSLEIIERLFLHAFPKEEMFRHILFESWCRYNSMSSFVLCDETLNKETTQHLLQLYEKDDDNVIQTTAVKHLFRLLRSIPLPFNKGLKLVEIRPPLKNKQCLFFHLQQSVFVFQNLEDVRFRFQDLKLYEIDWQSFLSYLRYVLPEHHERNLLLNVCRLALTL